MQAKLSRYPLLVLLAIVAFHPDFAEAVERKTYELNNGSVVTGVVIDEGNSGYLIRTPDGETVRVAYTDIKQVTPLGGTAVQAAPVKEVPQVGFASNPMVVVESGFRFPRGSRIVFLPFKNNESKDPRDSQGTGASTQGAIFMAMQKQTNLSVNSMAGHERSATVGLTRAEAVDAIKKAEVDYAVYGDCNQFYSVASGTFRTDKAGMTVEIVSADGTVVFQEAIEKNAITNFQTPEGLLEKMAKDLVERVKP